MKEKKISTFTQKNYRLQMLKITVETAQKYYQPETQTYENFIYEYEIRKNRRILARYNSLYLAKKNFASIICDELLQQKFTF